MGARFACGAAALCLSFAGVALGQVEVGAGDTIEVESTNPVGVPLHAESHPSMKGRVPNGSHVEVLQIARQGHWLEVDGPGTADGWITRKYVKAVVSQGGDDPKPADEHSVWTSAEACNAVVGAGRRMAAFDPAKLRLATWNIRWFPDGENTPDPDNAIEETDLAWLSCVIAWLNVDVVALQGIRAIDEAAVAWEIVLDELEVNTGSEWRVDLQECSQGPKSPHVGFLWNTGRVSLTNQADVWELNAAATDATDPCAGNLRPGRYARLESQFDGGADFHLLTAHLDPGVAKQDFTNRRTVYQRLDHAVGSLLPSDSDVLILGDFKTMGNVEDPVSAAEEIAAFTVEVALDDPANPTDPVFERFDVSPRCSRYFEGKAGWLDHVLVTSEMGEATSRTARLTGYCALENCDQLNDNDMPPAYRRLSDHCPIVVEVGNLDSDP